MRQLAAKSLLGTMLLASSLTIQASDQYYNFGFVGASASYGQSVFNDSDDAGVSIEPNLFYNGEYGFIDGSLVNFSVSRYVGITGNLRFPVVSNDFDDIPSGIEDRDGNGELGFTLGTVGARLTFLHDITSEHDGYEVQLHVGRTLDLPFNNFTLTPYLEVDYRDKKLSQHLYSISGSESLASGLNQFDASSSWVYQGGLIGIYELTPNWLALAKTEFEHHTSNSPLIQRDLGWAVSLGVTYKFTQ